MLNPGQNLGCCLALVFAMGITTYGPGSSQQQPNAPQGVTTSPDGIWTLSLNADIAFEKSVVDVKPNSYVAFKLNPAALKFVLQKAPKEFSVHSSGDPTIMTFPSPDGIYRRFLIEESPIMEPALAESFPRIKAYQATGIDDPTATGRFELTPEGLHAMVLSASGTFFVDAVGTDESGPYVSYFHSSLPPDPHGVTCLVKGQPRRRPNPKEELKHHPSPAAGDSTLRTYRIAVAASHRYVAAIHKWLHPNGSPGDLVPDALMAIHRTINRVNLIYRTDLGVRFVIIGKETKIIYANEDTDPYFDKGDPDQLLEDNQQNLDRIIGSGNYDIGHLFIVEPGGVAAQPCACNASYKAEGMSGRDKPFGNAFDVNLVAHEIGHQFGASHTFNGTTRGCQYRNADTAYEPGSGSTIMAYASDRRICDAETVQALSDPYFHAFSLREINNYITDVSPGNGDSCPQRTATTNLNRPVVNAGGNHTIPNRTPFRLTIASSSDGDGDALVYSWEEMDLGDPDPPDPNDPQDFKKVRPLFRSFQWNLNQWRTFPAMRHLLHPPATYIAEALPTSDRTMVFRATARDKRGRYGYDDVQIRVLATQAGVPVNPFVLTSPRAGAVWRTGSTQTVRWSVGTSLPPINCASVKISLIINGDESHPILLANSAPNNGSKTITVPVSTPPTSAARVKVEAIDNIFFNVSKGDIQITNR